jgi:hypothetical protein
MKSTIEGVTVCWKNVPKTVWPRNIFSLSSKPNFGSGIGQDLGRWLEMKRKGYAL